MKKIIWFSRHQPSTEQVEDWAAAGAQIVDGDYWAAVASQTLSTCEEVEAIADELGSSGVDAVYGVFTPALQHELTSNAVLVGQIHEQGGCPGSARSIYRRAIPCWASWSINRAPEGERPCFQHKCWIGVGQLLSQK